MTAKEYPVTPDGRYFVVKDRLWRCKDPRLPQNLREAAVCEMMGARRAVKDAATESELRLAKASVHLAKLKLGERGPVWWHDGSQDVNRHHRKNTRYADWWCELCQTNAAEDQG